jgi:hypothetical protein
LGIIDVFLKTFYAVFLLSCGSFRFHQLIHFLSGCLF